MELWDAYDAAFNRIEGVTLVRGEPIPKGMHHLVSEVIVRHTSGAYLIMRRSPEKKYGLMWEATSGGSALCGETPYQCAVRELFEETGVTASSLTEVGRTVTFDSIYVEFLCITDCPMDSVRLQAGETCDHKWVSREELLSMKKDELLTCRMQCFIKELGGEPGRTVDNTHSI